MLSLIVGLLVTLTPFLIYYCLTSEKKDKVADEKKDKVVDNSGVIKKLQELSLMEPKEDKKLGKYEPQYLIQIINFVAVHMKEDNEG